MSILEILFIIENEMLEICKLQDKARSITAHIKLQDRWIDLNNVVNSLKSRPEYSELVKARAVLSPNGDNK